MHTVTVQDIINMVGKSELNLSEDLKILDPKEDLRQQGLDSLDMANLLFELESAFEIHIDDESIANGEWKTLEKMVNSINNALRK